MLQVATGTKKYDFMIVGAGLYGATISRLLADRGYRVAVCEKRDHIAGNAYTRYEDGICIHEYGAHIFHTDSEKVWNFVNRFSGFHEFINEPVAFYRGRYFSLPFNMNTFRQIWGVTEPCEARKIIAEQVRSASLDGREPANLEEKAISQIGTELYEKLVRGYTEKQWGRMCSELPAAIMGRVPVRFEYDNRYYDDRYQGIPDGGYTEMVRRMLDGIEVLTETDFNDPHVRSDLMSVAGHIVYSGQIDEYFGYCLGSLSYRSLRFEHERIQDRRYLQDRAVINYTDIDVPYTRTIEHKFFEDPAKTDFTIVTREYPLEWNAGDIPFYPVGDAVSIKRYAGYREMADALENVTFGGRLGCYRYYDMDEVIESAMKDAERLTRSYGRISERQHRR